MPAADWCPVSPALASSPWRSSADGEAIGTVEVEGAKTAGANGSSDVTATEGTHSYTTDAMSVGSKTAQSIRETPQSVTVITQQQRQDQNITNLTQVLTQAAGVEVTTTNGNAVYYSRGFQITNFQIDGSPIGANPFPSFAQPGLATNLAEYDHVEVLRGPDGMFAGNGDPGGTVNLTRKKPLDHTQVIFEGAVGSWNNDRAIDVSAPVLGTEAVRTRFVVEDQQQDYFCCAAAAPTRRCTARLRSISRRRRCWVSAPATASRPELPGLRGCHAPPTEAICTCHATPACACHGTARIARRRRCLPI